MCNIQKLKNICEKYNLFLIEDAAEAFGSEYRGRKSEHLETLLHLVFLGTKLLLQEREGWFIQMMRKKIKRVASLKNQAVSSEIEYWHEEIGYNYRMTNICAAIGLVQQSPKILSPKKQKIAFLYKDYLKNLNNISERRK